MMDIWEEDQWIPGVLSKSQLNKLIEYGYVGGVTNFASVADHSSFDLCLSNEGYEMVNGSIKPCGIPYLRLLRDQKYAKRISPDAEDCFKLHANKCYVFLLKERLFNNLSKSNIFGQATAKSSIGRMDVIARLIVDGMHQYEYLDSKVLGNATGQLYIEITPISFNVRVKEGISLSQLRLFYGNIENSIITDKGFIKSILHGCKDGEGYLSVDITNMIFREHPVAAFRADVNVEGEDFIDLWEKETSERPAPWNYWSFDQSNDDRIKIDNGKFYILRSKERITLPSGVAVYCKAMDESLGEMRIHYAGFVHPFFGMKRDDGKTGTPLIFEVRGHNVDVNLADGERLARLIFYRMSEDAKEEDDKEPSSEGMDKMIYNKQELQLSKFFQDWPKNFEVDDNGRVNPLL